MKMGMGGSKNIGRSNGWWAGWVTHLLEFGNIKYYGMVGSHSGGVILVPI